MADALETMLNGTSLPNEVKAKIWDAYQGTQTSQQFESAFTALPIDKALKAQLWDLKFAGGREPDFRTEVVQALPPEDRAIGVEPAPGWRILRSTAPMVGAVLGGASGLAAGTPAGPVGMFWGAVAGAGLGAAGGESLTVALEALGRKLGAGEGLRKPTVTDALSRVTSAGTTGMVSEATGQATGPILGALAAPFKKKLAPFAQEAMQTFQGRVLPGEISESRILGHGQKLAQASFGGNRPVSEVQAARDALADQKVFDVLDSLGPSVSSAEAGRSVQRHLPAITPATQQAQSDLESALAARAVGQEARAVQREGWQQSSAAEADRIVTQVGPRATPTLAGASVRQAQAEAIKAFRKGERTAWQLYENTASDVPMESPRLDAFIGQLRGREAATILPNAGVSAARRIETLMADAGEEAMVSVSGEQVAVPPRMREALVAAGALTEPEPITAAQFAKTVSNLGQLTRSLERAAKFDPSKFNAQLGLSRKLYELARADLESTLEGSSVNALAAYREATTLSRLGNQRLFNEEVRRIVRNAPEKITDRLLTPNNSTAIQATRGAVGSEAMQGVQSVALQKILTPDPKTQIINWGRVVTKLSTLGDDTLTAMFPNGEAAGVKRIALSVLESERILKQQAQAEASAVAVARRGLQTAKTTGTELQAIRRSQSPEKIVGMLFRRDNVTAVTALRQSIGEDAFRPVQRVALESVLAPDAVTGRIDWPSVLKRIDRIDGDTLEAFYPEGQAQEVRRVAHLLVRLKEQVPRLTGRTGDVGLVLTQWGAVAALAHQVGTLAFTDKGSVVRLAGEGAILLGPAALSRIFTNPTALRWLSTGLKAPTGSREAMTAASQLTSFLIREHALTTQDEEARQQAPSAGPAIVSSPTQ